VEASWLGGCSRLVVILDTSMLLDIARGLIPLSSISEAVELAYELVVPSSVLRELEGISRSSGVKSRYARRALELLEVAGVKVYDDRLSDADEAIVELALNLKGKCSVVVATNDKALRRRLRSLDIPTAYYRRARGGLEVEWLPPA